MTYPVLEPLLTRHRQPFTSVLTVLCTLLLAGCGDVRGSDALAVDGRGSSYLAVQDGLGPWQPLAADAEHTLTLADPAGRYGLLSVCTPGGSGVPNGNLSVNVQHALLRDAPAAAGCAADEPAPATVRLTGTARGLAAGAYGNLYVGDASALLDSAAPTGRLELPAGRYDLVASRYSGLSRVPDRLVLEPGVDLARSRVVDLDFGGPAAFTPARAELRLSGVRPGELLSGSATLLTPGGTSALLGEYTGGDTLPYADVPAERLRGGRLRAEVQSFTYDDRTKAGSSRSLTRFLTGDPALRLPAPLDAPELTLSAAEAVRPAARWRAYRAGAGVYAQFYSQIRGGRAVSYRLSQSSAWLGGRPLSYALPDFSALAGWDAAWDLVPGQELFWDVSFSQETPLQTLFVSRSGVLEP